MTDNDKLSMVACIFCFSFKVKCARSVPAYFAETLYYAMKVRQKRCLKWPVVMACRPKLMWSVLLFFLKLVALISSKT